MLPEKGETLVLEGIVLFIAFNKLSNTCIIFILPM